jgi:hypothetical protein
LYYINNDVNYLSIKPYYDYPITNIIKQEWKNSSGYQQRFNYSISKSLITIKSTDLSTSTLTRNISLGNYSTTAYNTYINSTRHVQYNKAGTITETLTAGTSSFVIGHASNDEPKPKALALGAIFTAWDYDSTAKELEFTCTGSGGFTITNLHALADLYSVYKDGVFVEETYTNDYTASSCSSWLFTTSTYYQRAKDDTTSSLAVLTAKIPLLATIMIAAFIISILFSIVYGTINGFDYRTFVKMAFIFMLIALFLIIALELTTGI